MSAAMDWDDLPDVLPESAPHPLDGQEERSRLRLALRDGRVIEGAYNPIAGQHFLHCTGPGLPLIGQVEGPLRADEIATVEVVMTRGEIRERARELLQGPRVPGREPVTRDDFEHRLRTLARAVAAVPEAEWQMQIRLKRQFDACAERISLAPGKRTWMLAEARWARRSNAPPTMADLWVEPVASASCFARPRPQAFDPDPAVRRRRVPLPPEVRADPFSVPNMLGALVGAGLKARITRLGDPPYQRGHIQVEMPVKGRAHFLLQGALGEDGRMRWLSLWGGNDSKAGQKRYRKAIATPAYGAMVRILREGRRLIQTDLFLRPA
ncbi:hypothetical protein QMO56_19025 [Roseomonas sp. E05]|uniref:hypothetical protein n=1 Tax=Roseomonas sp. E05 TaxID=3046310 RepID=UPI0024B8E5D7|nr:hypothetical protein [Roseomonas sp. E05]MDJ0390208.1 hypothetical protein [Roseomonas sp. E05]